MKKGILAAVCAAALCAACLTLSGCAALLERSYSVVEPYADRYWDTSAEDTLRVDNYQDLVNSLLMLVEQRSEEAVIRCADEVSSYQDAMRARNEVLRETADGSYLLENIRFSHTGGASYSTATFQMTYRKDVEDPDSLMLLSDTQSLVDLLRLAVREEHEKITVRFTYDTPAGEISAAVEDYWRELCRDEMGLEANPPEPSPPEDGEPEDGESGDGESEDGTASSTEETPPAEEEAPPPSAEESASEDEPSPDGEKNGLSGDGEAPVSGQEELPVVYPPCPWAVRFYPNRSTAEIVEILLAKK